MIQDPCKGAVEQGFHSLISSYLEDGVQQMFVVELLSSSSVEMTSSLDLESKLAHVQGVSDDACHATCSHRAEHALEETNVWLLRGLFALLALFVDFLEVSLNVIFYQHTFQIFIKHEV